MQRIKRVQIQDNHNDPMTEFFKDKKEDDI